MPRRTWLGRDADMRLVEFTDADMGDGGPHSHPEYADQDHTHGAITHEHDTAHSHTAGEIGAAKDSHEHNLVHTHDAYAATEHGHDTSHDHDGAYAAPH